MNNEHSVKSVFFATQLLACTDGQDTICFDIAVCQSFYTIIQSLFTKNDRKIT